jgi:hypothetical protein
VFGGYLAYCKAPFVPPVVTPLPISHITPSVFVRLTKPIELLDVDVKSDWLLKVVFIKALVPFGVTPVLAKVHPLLKVPVKLELFKFCAHAAALAPTIG